MRRRSASLQPAHPTADFRAVWVTPPTYDRRFLPIPWRDSQSSRAADSVLILQWPRIPLQARVEENLSSIWRWPIGNVTPVQADISSLADLDLGSRVSMRCRLRRACGDTPRQIGDDTVNRRAGGHDQLHTVVDLGVDRSLKEINQLRRNTHGPA